MTQQLRGSDVAEKFGYTPYSGPDIPTQKVRFRGPSVRVGRKEGSKLVSSIRDVIRLTGLEDGMTISFHHHLRGGDEVFNQVMREIIDVGIKDLTLAPSSLTGVMNDVLVEAIRTGTVTHITTSGMRGSAGEFISAGGLASPVVFRSHGGRARAIEVGDIAIDVAFLGVSSSDEMGNATGAKGRAAVGSLGYALVDARYANQVVLITDELAPYPNDQVSINESEVDFVVTVDSIGDPSKIGTGATRLTKNPKELRIASLTSQVIVHSGLFTDGFSLQTGSGGASLAVTRYLEPIMREKNVVASFLLGGITTQAVQLLKDGLARRILDVQDFDRGSAQAMISEPDQEEIDASWYADPFNRGAVVSNLDVAVLSALEIDTGFNVNVLTGSDGVVRGAIGGHQDAATSKLSIITVPLVRGRIASVVDHVDTLVTPGSTVDVVVTEMGVAVNPARGDLAEHLQGVPGLPVLPIEDLAHRAGHIVGEPAPIAHTDREVGLVEYRDGSLIDVVRGVVPWQG